MLPFSVVSLPVLSDARESCSAAPLKLELGQPATADLVCQNTSCLGSHAGVHAGIMSH